jgi:hypothetical protein
MLKQLMLAAAVAVALIACSPSHNSVRAEDSGNGASVTLANYDRPPGYVYYRVWYTSRRMGYWALYTVTPNKRWAENVASMLAQRGYDPWVEPFVP